MRVSSKTWGNEQRTREGAGRDRGGMALRSGNFDSCPFTFVLRRSLVGEKQWGYGLRCLGHRQRKGTSINIGFWRFTCSEQNKNTTTAIALRVSRGSSSSSNSECNRAQDTAQNTVTRRSRSGGYLTLRACITSTRYTVLVSLLLHNRQRYKHDERDSGGAAATVVKKPALTNIKSVLHVFLFRIQRRSLDAICRRRYMDHTIFSNIHTLFVTAPARSLGFLPRG